jgi:hypothetical protein
MLTALVLICAAEVAARCPRLHAQQRKHGDARTGRVRKSGDMLHACAGISGGELDRELDANEQVRIICLRSETITASVRPR